jgi:WD40 repeat protein
VQIVGDSDDYYVFVPPDPVFREACGKDAGESGEQEPPAQDVIEWFYSGKTPVDFAAKRQSDLETALAKWKRMGERQRWESTHQSGYTFVPTRSRWSVAFSNNDRFVAVADANFLCLYDQSVSLKADAPLYQTTLVDCRVATMTFSRRSQYLAYSEADGTPVLYDLKAKEVRWKGKVSRDDGKPTYAVQLGFSGETKYVMAILAQGSPKVERTSYSPTLDHRRHGKRFCAWEVASGRLMFTTPQDSWQDGLTIVASHPDDPALVRLTKDRYGPNQNHQIWDVATGKPSTRDLTDPERWEPVPRGPWGR